MLLNDKLRVQGDWLFRWRSYLPLTLLPIAVIAATESQLSPGQYGASTADAWDVFCLVVALSGLAVRVLTIGFVPSGTSGRNSCCQRADSLNTNGMYSIVRNPLYLGNLLTLLGFLLAIQVWWFCLVGGLGFALYYERIIVAEEAFLHGKFGRAYMDWAARTPALVPRPTRWRNAALRFSIRTVMRREYNGLCLIFAYFALNEIASEVVLGKLTFAQWYVEDWPWLLLLATGVATLVTLRTLKRRTHVLDVPGR